MGAEDRGQSGILQPPLEHEAHGVGRQVACRKAVFCLPRAARNKGRSPSGASAWIPAASRYSPSQRSRSWRTGISRCLPPFSRNLRTRWGPWSSRSPRRKRAIGTDAGPGVGQGAEAGPDRGGPRRGRCRSSGAGRGPGGWKGRGSYRRWYRASCRGPTGRDSAVRRGG